MQVILCPNKMEEFWILILVSFFAINSLDKAESVQLEEKPFKIIDEIFGEGWWDKDKAEEWHKLTLEQNFHHQIGRQNTQIGQIEPNATDQNPPIIESDHSGQIEPKMKYEFKQKGRYSKKERTQIEEKIANHLNVNRKINELKQKYGLSQKVYTEKEERKHLVEKFDQMKAELKRDGFKNSYSNQINETVAKELCITYRTIYAWKLKLGQTKPQHKYSHSEQKELLKHYYEINDKKPKISDEKIAKMLKIDVSTLRRWKKLHPNVVDGHSVEKDAAGSNIQEIENSNLGSI